MTDLTAVIDELPASEREQGLRLQATRWAAARGSIAVWRRLQATGERFVVESRTPRTIGERLQVAAAAYEAARTGTAAEARELALQALADGRLLEDPGPESGGFWIAPFVLVLAHADDDQVRVTTEVIEWAKQHGSLPAFSMAAQLRAYAYLRSGSLADAEADATSALEHPAVPGLFPFGRIALVNVLLARDKATEACDVFEQIRPEPAAPGYFRYLQTRARLRAALQHPEDALEDLFECGRLEEEWEIRTPAFGSWRADAAPLLARSVARTRRARCAREELERCRAFGAPGPLGISLRTLGLVEPGDTGIELLEQSVAQLERSSRRLELAISLLELGSATRRARSARRRAQAAPRSARARPCLRCRRGCRARPRRARHSGCAPPPRPDRESQHPHCLRAARRSYGRRRYDQPRDRAGPLPDREHDRDAPPQRLPQARHPLALAARSRPLAARPAPRNSRSFSPALREAAAHARADPVTTSHEPPHPGHTRPKESRCHPLESCS